MGSRGPNTHAMLIVEIDVVHLEVNEGLFTGLPYVFRLSIDGIFLFIEDCPEFGANEYFAPEIGVLKHRSQESLICSLIL